MSRDDAVTIRDGIDLRSHDKTQVLKRLVGAIQEGQRDLEDDSYKAHEHIQDDGTSQVLEVIPARYSANISFRRVDGEGWGGERGYVVDVNGPSRFVSDVLNAACGSFIDSEER